MPSGNDPNNREILAMKEPQIDEAVKLFRQMENFQACPALQSLIQNPKKRIYNTS